MSAAVGAQGLLQSSVTLMRCHLDVHDKAVNLPFHRSPSNFQPQSFCAENTKQIPVVGISQASRAIIMVQVSRDVGKPERLLEHVLAGRVVVWRHPGVRDPGEQGSGVAGWGAVRLLDVCALARNHCLCPECALSNTEAGRALWHVCYLPTLWGSKTGLKSTACY